MRQKIPNIDPNRFLQPPRRKQRGRLDVLEMPKLFNQIKNEYTPKDNRKEVNTILTTIILPMNAAIAISTTYQLFKQ